MDAEKKNGKKRTVKISHPFKLKNETISVVFLLSE